MSPLLKPTWTRVFLPLLTLGFPLGVLLMILLRLPVEQIEIASTDTRLLAGFSTFWCGWQEVTSTHPFYAYKVPETPKVVENKVTINHLAFRFTLSKGHYHYLRYHMLEGSSIECSGCAGDHPVQLDVVYGRDSFESCWPDRKSRPEINRRHSHSRATPSFKTDSSSEEEEEEEDDSAEEDSDEEDGSSYERRKRSPECEASLLSTRMVVASEKSDQDYPTCPARFVGSVKVTRPGAYYVMTRGDAFNHVLLHVRLNRSLYELPDNMILCRSQSTCEIPLSFGSAEKVVVFVSAEPDAGSVSFPVRSKCKPRLFFYVCVFLAFPSMFAVALTLAVRRARLGASSSSTSSASVERTNPLLETAVADDGAVKIGQPRRYDFSEPPPPYQTHNRLITLQLAPPSYERARPSSINSPGVSPPI